MKRNLPQSRGKPVPIQPEAVIQGGVLTSTKVVVPGQHVDLSTPARHVSNQVMGQQVAEAKRCRINKFMGLIIQEICFLCGFDAEWSA